MIGILKKWLLDHQETPYPTRQEKSELQGKTLLSHSQINDWFINGRRRVLAMRKSAGIMSQVHLRTQSTLQKSHNFEDSNTNGNDSSCGKVKGAGGGLLRFCVLDLA